METTKKQTAKKESQNLMNEKNVMNEILNSKNLMNDENLLNLDLENLDNVNFESLIKEVSKNIKQKKEKERDKI